MSPFVLGIYDATGAGGGPGTLIAQTLPCSRTRVSGASWLTCPLTAPVTLSAGTNYHLSVLCGSDTNPTKYATVSGVTLYYVSQGSYDGTLPASFGTPGGTASNVSDPIIAVGIANVPAGLTIPSAAAGWLLITDSFGHYCYDDASTTFASQYAMGNQLGKCLNSKQYDGAVRHHVVNYGISSQSTSNFLSGSANLIAAKLAAPAALCPNVIIELGLNDVAQSVSAATFKSNLQNIIADLQVAGYTKIFLCYPPYLWWGTMAAGAGDILFDYAAQIDSLVVAGSVYAVPALQDYPARYLPGWNQANIHVLEVGGTGMASALARGILGPLPAVASVVLGTAVGLSFGTYPTTATSKAEQLAEDQATVAAHPEYIVDGETVLGTNGTTPSNDANILAILADTAEIQADLANGGRLDLIFDATAASATAAASSASTAATQASNAATDAAVVKNLTKAGGGGDLAEMATNVAETLATCAVPGDAMTLAASEDCYWADIALNVDAGNSQDEWSVQWYQNSTPCTTGITLPTIQVTKRADGTDLIVETAMMAVGSNTGAYKYDATGTARHAAGEAIRVIVCATIGGSVRQTARWLFRDDA